MIPLERKLRTKAFGGSNLSDIANDINTFLNHQPGSVSDSFLNDSNNEWLFLVSIVDYVDDTPAPLGIDKPYQKEGASIGV